MSALTEFEHYWQETAAQIAAAASESAPFPEARALLAGGKHLRGTLTCLLAQACGAELKIVLPYAAAIDVIQSASLMHDDIIDGDTLRRGAPATWTRVGARRAILLGDVLFADAIARTAVRSASACRILTRAIAATASGAYREPLSTEEIPRAPNRSVYTRIARGKTAALFAAAATLGALAAQTNFTQVRAAYRYGMHLGLAFQVADDLADFDTVRSERTPPLAPPLRLAMTCFSRSGADGRDARAAALRDLDAYGRRQCRRARACIARIAPTHYRQLLDIAPDALATLLRYESAPARSATMMAEP